MANKPVYTLYLKHEIFGENKSKWKKDRGSLSSISIHPVTGDFYLLEAL